MIRLKALSLGEGWERLQPIDEYKPAGKYEVTYYANNHPSGVYIYQLIAENYLETRKMVILK